jgi:uncharacterized RDD family membrane protein YckC
MWSVFFMKIPIEKIPVEMYRTVHVKDASGKRVATKEKYRTFLKVKCVETGHRIGHWILDALVVFAVVGPIGYIMDINGINLSGAETSNIYLSFYNLESIFITFIFYFLFEWKFARTPGKWITRTIVVNEFGEKPDGGTIAIRTLCRLIPFEAFSCFSESGQGWHDKFSKTYVIPLSEHDRISSILKEQGAENQMTR